MAASSEKGSSPAEDESNAEREASKPLLDSEVLPVGKSPVYGDPDAPMTIVVFPASNYSTIPDLQQVVEAYDGEVRLVLKHLKGDALVRGAKPGQLRESDGSDSRDERMALVLEALRRQDPKIYWPATRVLAAARPDFEEHPPEEVGAELAEQYGLDVDAYRADLDDPETAAAVEQDAKLAQRLGITGRSTVVFNGQKVGGMYLEMYHVVELVERHLEVLDQLREEGTDERALYQAAIDRAVLEEGRLPEIEKTLWKHDQWRPPEIRPVKVRPSDPRRGPEEAPVTIVQVADLEGCLPCARQHAALKYAVEAHPDKVRVVFKYSPRALDKSESMAARALAAAGRQDRFWETYTKLMEDERHRDPPSDVSPEKLAGEVGLELERFRRDMESAETTDMIEQSAGDVRSAGCRVVPSLIVNGIEMMKPGPKDLKAVVEKQLELVGRLRDERGLSGQALQEAVIEYNDEHTREVWLGQSDD